MSRMDLAKFYQYPTDGEKLTINFTDGKIAAGGIKLNDGSLKWREIKLKGNDTYVVINTKMNLIEAYNNNNNKTGNIYNEYIDSGTFFKIPIGKSEMQIIKTQIESTESEIDSTESIKVKSIEYDYYYL